MKKQGSQGDALLFSSLMLINAYTQQRYATHYMPSMRNASWRYTFILNLFRSERPCAGRGIQRRSSLPRAVRSEATAGRRRQQFLRSGPSRQAAVDEEFLGAGHLRSDGSHQAAEFSEFRAASFETGGNVQHGIWGRNLRCICRVSFFHNSSLNARENERAIN